MSGDFKRDALDGSIISDSRFILERKRLNALLDKSLENLVVYITAGEGYGKTCAFHSFLNQRNITAIWIPLSESDNAPWHFWETVVKAVSLHNSPAGKALEEIGFPESSGQISRCLSILDLTIPERKKNVIVADDCHFIADKAILNFVNRLLAYPYPKATTLLISRSEPKLNTMTFLSKGLLSRITDDDLRFNEEEIAAYFRLREIKLTPEEPGKIFNDTEGWIQAISHIAGEMKNNDTQYSRSLLESGSFRNMEDALFSSIPVSLQRFLITLSLFDQWPLEAIKKTAAALPEKLPSIEELTEHTEHLSSFIQYDARLHGFRIHRAFLDYLTEKQKELSKAEKKTAYGIAAEWCMENNLYIEAASNYAKAGDYEKLLRAVYSFPWLVPKRTAAAFLEIIDRTIHDSERDEENIYFLFLRHMTRATILLNLGRIAEARSVIDETIQMFENSSPEPATGGRPSPPEDNSGNRIRRQVPGEFISWILSSCYTALGSISLHSYRMVRDISRTLEYYKRGNHYHRRHTYALLGPDTEINVGSYANPIGHSPGKGEYETFINTVEQCIPYVSNTLGGYLCGADSLCRAELAFFKGDLETAEQYAMEAVFKAREKRQYEIESKGLFYILRIQLCNGNFPASLETWEQMKAQLEIPGYINRYAIHDIMTGWFFAHTSETKLIAPWLKNEFGESSLNVLFHNFESMVRAKYLFAEEQFEEALKFLERKEVREGLGSFHLGMLEISALEAVIRSRMGDEAAAIKTLEAAYKLAIYNSGSCSAAEDRFLSFDLPFFELGEDMRNLAGAALNSEDCAIPKAWLDTIRNWASAYAKKFTAVKEQFRKSYGESGIPYLNSQELSILTDISRGLTREEISRDYSLSINTVKNIIKNIYNKLDAINRADAIRIATKLDIL